MVSAIYLRYKYNGLFDLLHHLLEIFFSLAIIMLQ